MAQATNPTAEDVEAQLARIRDEIDNSPPLSPPELLGHESCRLKQEYANDALFLAQVNALHAVTTPDAERFRSIRYARRDGNCFFRCASFRLFELMLRHRGLAATYLQQLAELRPQLNARFGEYSADFCDAMEEVINQICSDILTSGEDLRRCVSWPDYGYVLVFFRYAISLYIRTHEADYMPYIMGLGYDTIESYCSAEVEPVDHVSDNVQLAAFADMFKVVIHVAVLDRTSGQDRPVFHSFNTEQVQSRSYEICLLYTPGHYDLLER